MPYSTFLSNSLESSSLPRKTPAEPRCQDGACSHTLSRQQLYLLDYRRVLWRGAEHRTRLATTFPTSDNGQMTTLEGALCLFSSIRKAQHFSVLYRLNQPPPASVGNRTCNQIPDKHGPNEATDASHILPLVRDLWRVRARRLVPWTQTLSISFTKRNCHQSVSQAESNLKLHTKQTGCILS